MVKHAEHTVTWCNLTGHKEYHIAVRIPNIEVEANQTKRDHISDKQRTETKENELQENTERCRKSEKGTCEIITMHDGHV